MATIAEIKSYMHAEGEEDSAVAPFVAMAEAYLAGAGVREGEVRAAGWDLALKALTLHYYDNRDGAAVPEGLRSLVTQLQYARVESGSPAGETGDGSPSSAPSGHLPPGEGSPAGEGAEG